MMSTKMTIIHNSTGAPIPASNDTFSGEDMVLRFAVYYMNRYFMPVVVTIGLVGNTLSILVFLCTYLRRLSLSVYLAALSVSDSVFLVCLFIIWLEYVQIPIFHKNGICQIVIYSSYVSSFLSVWFVVSFSVERFISIWLPLRKPDWCTAKRARYVVIGLSVFALIVYSSSMWTSGIVLVKGKYVICTPLNRYTHIHQVLMYSDTVVTLIVPFVSLLFLNVTIAYRIWMFQHRRWIASSSSKTVLMRSRKPGAVCVTNLCDVAQIKVTKMVLLVSTVFLLVHLPSYTIRLYVFLRSFIDKNYVTPRREYFVQQLSQIIYYFGFSINFFLYSFCSDKFREAMGRFWWRVKYNLTTFCQKQYGAIRRAFTWSDHSDSSSKKGLYVRNVTPPEGLELNGSKLANHNI